MYSVHRQYSQRVQIPKSADKDTLWRESIPTSHRDPTGILSCYHAIGC
jgi:hypothetical protein